MHLIGVWAAAYWDWCNARTRSLSFWMLPVFVGVAFLGAIAAIELLPVWAAAPIVIVVFGPGNVFVYAWQENARRRMDRARTQNAVTRKVQQMIDRETRK